MNKNTTKPTTAIAEETKAIPQNEIAKNQNEIVESDETDDDEILDEEEFDDDEWNEDVSDEEEETEENSSNTEPKEETLTPFATIIKNYLETLAQTDEEIAKTLDRSIHSYNMCSNYIHSIAEKMAREKGKGFQVAQISDDECYVIMKNYYVDGTYYLQLEEEKQKAEEEKEKKLAKEQREKERREKEELKRKEEEEEKRRAEEEKRRWEMIMNRPEDAKKEMSEDEILIIKTRHATQGSLFDF